MPIPMDPQAWWEVLSPPPQLAQDCANLVASLQPQGDLSQAQLGQLVTQIYQRPELWQPLIVIDPDRRRYRLLYEDERIDCWVLSWMPGQNTGFHDHDLSSVGLICAQGMAIERQMLLPSGATTIEMTPGYCRQGGPGYIHSVSWGQGEPAVSIHAYSPPLIRVGQYMVDQQGTLERRVAHGRQELMDHSIAERDPSRA